MTHAWLKNIQVAPVGASVLAEVQPVQVDPKQIKLSNEPSDIKYSKYGFSPVSKDGRAFAVRDHDGYKLAVEHYAKHLVSLGKLRKRTIEVPRYLARLKQTASGYFRSEEPMVYVFDLVNDKDTGRPSIIVKSRMSINDLNGFITNIS